METGSTTLSLVGELNESTIYLMGGSFVLGSLFTVILLLLLDFIRRNGADANKSGS